MIEAVALSLLDGNPYLECVIPFVERGTLCQRAAPAAWRSFAGARFDFCRSIFKAWWKSAVVLRHSSSGGSYLWVCGRGASGPLPASTRPGFVRRGSI